MYWRWQSIPELADLPIEQRKSVWRQAKRDPFRAIDIAWFLLILGITGLLCLVLYWLRSTPNWVGQAVSVVGAVLLSFIYEALLIVRYRPVIRRLRHGGQ